jgi:hypothetical protein
VYYEVCLEESNIDRSVRYFLPARNARVNSDNVFSMAMGVELTAVSVTFMHAVTLVWGYLVKKSLSEEN